MTSLDIKVQSKAEAGQGPLFPDLTPANTERIKTITVGILEGGMVSGATSVVFKFTTSDGQHYIAETSARILDALHSALTGAQDRFNNGTS